MSMEITNVSFKCNHKPLDEIGNIICQTLRAKRTFGALMCNLDMFKTLRSQGMVNTINSLRKELIEVGLALCDLEIIYNHLMADRAAYGFHELEFDHLMHEKIIPGE